MRRAPRFRPSFLFALLACAILSASALFSATAQAQPKPPKGKPTAEMMDRAREHMAAGVSFFNEKEGARYEEAYPEFRKAYELSGSLNALENLGLCAFKLERDGEAITLYELLLEKKKNMPAEKRKQVQKDLQRLKATVAWVTINADMVDVEIIDTRTPLQGNVVRNIYEIGRSKRKIGIHPGKHVFVASAEGKEDVEWKVDIKNGGEYQHEFVFDKGPVTAEGLGPDDFKDGKGNDVGEGERPTPVYVWVTLGITVAAAVPMGIFMGSAVSQKADYEDNLLNQAPLAEQQAAVDDIESTNLLADVFIGVTGAAAVTTLILYLTRPEVNPEPAKKDKADDKEARRGPRKRQAQFGVDWKLAPLVDHRGGGGALFSASF